jgi:RNA polymerase sigma factor (sigma-70 family)
MKQEITPDEFLVREAVNGCRHSLEELIKRHQNFIYNVALKMVYYPPDASDITQEVLIKIITNLSSFRLASSFRTWAYRITVNHVLNVKKSRAETMLDNSFPNYGESIDRTPDAYIDTNSPENAVLIEEVKITCLQGMLLCLNRKQRMAFILGSIFCFSDIIGCEMMNISKDNFRQLLSRARKSISSFMNEKCGLVKSTNPCHCRKKTKSMIDSGAVNPKNLLFNRNYLYSIETAVPDKLKSLDDLIEDKSIGIFRTMPYNETEDFTLRLKELLESDNFKNIFNFN